jgi:hypothetical protein
MAVVSMTIKDFRGDMKSVAAASGNGVVGAIPGRR